tara:strand:+ start:4745 stop:6400 length:1656 start_codon:yes stop_codon:yes gene_type:complete
MCLVAGTLIAGLGATASASAAEWKVGNIDFNMKSTLSAGTGMRVSNPKASNISVFNGGTDTTPAAENFDDGNLNFRRGDIFTASVRMLHEIDASWENYGAFVSVGYFYDFINSSESSTRRTDLSDATRSLAGRRIDLYDAYIYGDFDVGGSPLTVRLGNQVINWGEALFRPGGVSQTNAVDVGKLVTPGTNIREAYLPSPMIYANLGLTSGLSVEAYYQFMWRETRLIPVGTFHSTEDILGDGAEGFFFAGDPGSTGLTAEQMITFGLGIPRLANKEPRNSGQYGAALRYYIEDIATEVSAYYLRYHMKTPSFGIEATGFLIPFPPFVAAAPVGYYSYFPEGIDLYGTSVSFPIGDVAIGAEAVYQPDFPVLIDDPITPATIDALTSLSTVRNNGFTRADRWGFNANAQVTIGPSLAYIGQLPSMIGADFIDVISEVSAVHFTGDKPAGTTKDMSSWGLTLVASATYSNVLTSGLTLKPNVNLNWGVNGTAIDQATAGTSVENTRALSVGVSADYRTKYTGSISYTNNMGGGTVTRNSDRDYVTLTASYSF